MKHMKGKRLCAFVFALALTLGVLSGCTGKTSELQESAPPSYPLGEVNGCEFTGAEGVSNSSTELANKGNSDYSIVIPQNAGDYILFAASELQALFCEATGAELPILTDESVDYSESGKYISIGATSLQADAGVTCDYSVFKESGVRMATKGNTVILTGAREEGALYAVYDFLNVLFDYEFYDQDAYTLNKAGVVQLPLLDHHDIPDLDYRMYGDFQQYDAVGGSEQHAFRLRYKVYGQGHAMDGHTATYIISEADYFNDHPDWFSTEVGEFAGQPARQLCYTNEEMTEQFIENVKELLDEKPDTTAISIAQADVNIWCHCEKCSAAMEQYGNGTPNLGAVTQNLFVNKVVKAVDEWLAEAYPGRSMTYMILAYHQTEVPPTHKDADGNYVPNAPEMMLPSNVLVQYASIYTDRNICFKENPSEYEKIKAWAACAPNLQIYEYPAHVTHVCMPYDGLHVFADNLRFAKELGFSSYYMQGNFNTESSGFTPLKIYVASKLMWDTELDPMELAYDYIDHCYGDAAPYMRQYFDLLRSQLAVLRAENSYGSSVFETGVTVTNWPITLIHSYQGLFNQAYDAIDHVKRTDPEEYEVLFRKIMIEEMFLRYVNCSLYLNYYSDTEKAQMIDEFEEYATRYGFKNYSETTPMSEIIAVWRGQL